MISSAQVIPCGRLELLAEALRQVRPESNVVILSCVTNYLTSSSGSSTSASLRVEPVLRSFLGFIEAAAAAQEERLFLINPPMYRSHPEWYRESLPEVLKKFSDVMVSKSKNVRLLPSFATPSFEADGVHLTPFSGLEFILHLFDSSEKLHSRFL